MKKLVEIFPGVWNFCPRQESPLQAFFGAFFVFIAGLAIYFIGFVLT